MTPSVKIRNVAGLNIPEHNYISFTYYGATNNAQTVTYREGRRLGHGRRHRDLHLHHPAADRG
jgi:hypothetical protein